MKVKALGVRKGSRVVIDPPLLGLPDLIDSAELPCLGWRKAASGHGKGQDQ